MKFLALFLLWCIVLVLSWPVALVVLLLAPLVAVFAIVFKLVGISVGAVFALLKSILFLPARLLGHRG